MDSHRSKLKKIKTSGSFKRKVRQNFLRIYNGDLTTPHRLNMLSKTVHQFEDGPDYFNSLEPSSVAAESSMEIKVNRTDNYLENSITVQINDNREYPDFEKHSVHIDEESASSFENEEQDLFCTDMMQNIDLLNSLRTWAVTFNIKHNALKELLVILNKRLSDVLPRDPRTLVRTPHSVSIQNVTEGQYWHHGLKYSIEKVCSDVSGPVSLSLKINIDGLPIYKSSKDEFWPILFSIYEMPQINLMIIGIYSGKRKPADIIEFLSPFVDEMEDVYKNGTVTKFLSL